MTFKIDTVTVKEPATFTWEPPVELGIDHAQKPIYGAYRSAVASFNTLTAAEFKQWNDADNAAYHTLQGVNSSGSTATYSNVIIRLAGGDWGAGGEFYGASFRVERLT